MCILVGCFVLHEGGGLIVRLDQLQIDQIRLDQTRLILIALFSLSRCIHYIDNRVPPPEEATRLYKVQWIVELANALSEFYWNPGENISLDESVLRYTGRLKFKTYNPNKPVKVILIPLLLYFPPIQHKLLTFLFQYGLKAYVCADAQGGMMLQMRFYTGQHQYLKDTIFGLVFPYLGVETLHGQLL